MPQSQEELREVSFNGKVYKTDGKSLWIDGVLQNLKMPDEVKSIKEVKVLEVDGRLYHNNEWFSPISLTTEKIRGEGCPPHDFIPHQFVGGWGGSTPPPNMKCRKCLQTEYF